MKRSPALFVATFLLMLLLAEGLPLFAQDSPTTQEPETQQPSTPAPLPEGVPPKAAGRGNPTFGEVSDVDDSGVLMTPDSTALTGVQVATLGTQAQRHSYFVPGFQYGNLIRSSTDEAPQTEDWNSTNFVAGNLSLLQQWSRAELAVNYTGGATFSTDPMLGNSQYHQLQAQQMFEWRQAKLLFVDQFSYLPQSDFGFGAASPLAIAGVGGTLAPSLPPLQTSYYSAQSTFSVPGPRYSNSAAVQLAYDLTLRSSLTVAASYGILRFVAPGNIASDDSILSLGYDYQVSNQDTVGVLYRLTSFRYLSSPQGINDHVVQLAYGRKITGRAALQLFVGPEITQLRIPLNGKSQQASVSGGGNLRYAFSRTTFGVNYNHGVSGGSGVYSGSTADQVTGSVGRKLTRTFDGNVNVGYSRNRSLGQQIGVPPQPTINSWFAGAGLNHPFGRTAMMALAYAAYIESSSSSCLAISCSSYLQHQISLSFQWHMRPVVIE